MSGNLKYLLGVFGLLLILFGLWYFGTLIAFLVIAAIISFIGGPIVRLLKRIPFGKKKMPNSLAALLTIGVFVFMIYLFLNIFAPLVADEAQALSKIDVNAVSANLHRKYEGIMQSIAQFNLSGDQRSNEAFLLDQLKEVVSFGDVRVIFNNIFGVIGNALVALFSILFIAFFFLKDGYLVGRIILTMTPDKHTDRMVKVLHQSKRLLTRYFGGLVIQVSLVTLLITLGLSLAGVRNAFLIGFLAGIINLVPYIGPIIGAGLGLFIAITTNLGMDFNSELLPLVLKISGTFLVVQMIDNFLIQPYIFSNSVNAHPLEIFIVISMAGTIAGIGGMIIAIPVYTLIRIIASQFLSGFKIVDSLTRNLES